MAIALTPGDDASLLQLGAAIDISMASELKGALLDALAMGKSIRVTVDEVTELDVTAFQLLWAAGRQAKQAGIGFTVTGKICEAAREALSAMGLNVGALSA